MTSFLFSLFPPLESQRERKKEEKMIDKDEGGDYLVSRQERDTLMSIKGEKGFEEEKM